MVKNFKIVAIARFKASLASNKYTYKFGFVDAVKPSPMAVRPVVVAVGKIECIHHGSPTLFNRHV